jgi:hypothetical protein
MGRSGGGSGDIILSMADVRPAAAASRESAVSVYIDQSRWVHLLQARERHPRQPEGAADALTTLRQAVEAGTAVVPLSWSHYHETWHVHAWQRRHALADLMRDLSHWATLAPIQAITGHELRALVRDGSANEVPREAIFGSGANHAFDSPTGRFVMVESLPPELYPSPDDVELPEVMRRIRDNQPAVWEWANLAGPPDDFPLAGLPDEAVFPVRPEHDRGDDWAQAEIDRRRRVHAAGLPARLHKALVLEDVAAIAGTVAQVGRELGAVPRAFVGPSEDAVLGVHALLPCRSTLVALEYFMLSERQYMPQQHDRLDLLAHAVALPYCDIVVTERRVADLGRRACVGERFGTEVLTKLADLPGALERRVQATEDEPRESAY